MNAFLIITFLAAAALLGYAVRDNPNAVAIVIGDTLYD